MWTGLSESVLHGPEHDQRARASSRAVARMKSGETPIPRPGFRFASSRLLRCSFFLTTEAQSPFKSQGLMSHSLATETLRLSSFLAFFSIGDETGVYYYRARYYHTKNEEGKVWRWPTTPGEMDILLGMRGKRFPDTPYTPGRGKVEWRPSDNVTIVYESHPYHPHAPDWHRGPHWHLDTPGVRHRRFLHGDPIPGFP